ncbi:MAG: tetratricopeptide repeat protein [Flectobacillus sp.]|uniref:tetratricopeptide repeat protein n=1 Tax=Flectobacillus sp. TaxID=50419 RepID=UPI003B9D83C0
MNSSFAFWKHWQKNTQWLFLSACTLAILCLVGLAYYYVNYLENVIHWDILSELDDITISLDPAQSADGMLHIPTKAYIIHEQFLASTMRINTEASWIFTILVVIALSLIHTGITFIPRTWYLIFTGLSVFLLITLQWDLFLNRTGNWVGFSIILGFVGLSYFFHAFKRDTSTLIRFLFFLVYWLIVGIVIIKMSSYLSAITHFCTQLIPQVFILGAIFIFGIAYEIPKWFVFVSTRAAGSQNLLNFVVLTLIYWVNILLVFLYNNKVIDWDMLYLNPFLVLAIAIILGIWSIADRMILAAKVLNHEFATALIYIGLAILTISGIFYAFATANDPMIEVWEDLITYSNLVMGILFLLYVLSNFYGLFKQGLPISKVLYKPLSLPIYVFRIMALIILVALFSMKSFYTINQAIAAYYNSLGDHQVVNKDYRFAEIAYKQALAAEFRNHKTNYALASLALLQNDNETAAVYFKRALSKNPSPYAYEGLARSFTDRDRFFDAMFTLKEASKKFPDNSELLTNLAYLYSKAKQLDSSLIYLEKAQEFSKQSPIVASNLVAFWAKNGKPSTQKDYLSQLQPFDYPSYQANTLALKLSTQAKAAAVEVSAKYDKALDVSTFAWLYNATLFQKSLGSAIPLRNFAQSAQNDQYSEDLEFAHTLQQFYKGDKQLTFEQLQAWATTDTSANKAKYYQVLLNTLIKKESSSDSFSENIVDAKAAQLAVFQHPLNEKVLEKTTTLYNSINKPEEAHRILNNALKWRKDSPNIWEMYILQSLNIGMTHYANDALIELQKRFPTDYQRFLPQYQAKIALIEKQSADFQ